MKQARIDKALSQLDADAANDYAVLRSNGVSEADALAAVSDAGYIVGDGGKGGAVASPVGRYTGTGVGFVDGLDFGAQRMLDDMAALSARVNKSWDAANTDDARSAQAALSLGDAGKVSIAAVDKFRGNFEAFKAAAAAKSGYGTLGYQLDVNGYIVGGYASDAMSDGKFKWSTLSTFVANDVRRMYLQLDALASIGPIESFPGVANAVSADVLNGQEHVFLDYMGGRAAIAAVGAENIQRLTLEHGVRAVAGTLGISQASVVASNLGLQADVAESRGDRVAAQALRLEGAKRYAFHEQEVLQNTLYNDGAFATFTLLNDILGERAGVWDRAIAKVGGLPANGSSDFVRSPRELLGRIVAPVSMPTAITVGLDPDFGAMIIGPQNGETAFDLANFNKRIDFANHAFTELSAAYNAPTQGAQIRTTLGQLGRVNALGVRPYLPAINAYSQYWR